MRERLKAYTEANACGMFSLDCHVHKRQLPVELRCLIISQPPEAACAAQGGAHRSSPSSPLQLSIQ